MATAEYMRNWKKNNPDKVIANQRRWREKNRDKAKENSRQWRARNLLRSRESALRWAKANPQRRLENNRRWREQNPERTRLNGRRSDLKKKYGLTLADYDALLHTQDGCCAVCNAKDEGRTLHVDHCHGNGTVRGLLCGACNLALGLLKENTATIQRLADYVNGKAAH